MAIPASRSVLSKKPDSIGSVLSPRYGARCCRKNGDQMATVLIVEDNPANMKLTSLLLGNAGHTVLCAVDAETGLTFARNDQPDLILMDLQLPGMDGLAATALLKQD